MTDAELTTYLEAACEAARRAGEVLAHWRDRFQVREKARFDLVTDADVASQQAISSYLHDRFPDHHFLGEEGPSAKHRPGPGSPPTWIVDPIDGTTNYVHDVPLYCISIGLHAEGDLVVGVVYDPVRNEMFRAARGQGAWLGERRLQVSSAARLEEALLATGFPPDLRGQDRMLEWWRYFSLRSQAIRRTGTTAINLAYVAAGRFDGYWAFDNHVWDVAGGIVLVREAGGVVTGADGVSFDPFAADSIAANPALHALLAQSLREGP